MELVDSEASALWQNLVFPSSETQGAQEVADLALVQLPFPAVARTRTLVSCLLRLLIRRRLVTGKLPAS